MKKGFVVFLCAVFLILSSACKKEPLQPAVKADYNGDHVEAQLDEHLHVDADIQITGEFKQADEFKSKPMDFDTSEVKAVLLGGSEIKEETEEHITTTDDKSIYISSRYGFFVRGNILGVLDIALLNPEYTLCNADKFSQTLDFDFMTMEQAVEAGQKLLKSMGFQPEILATQVYSLDYETLQAQEDYFKTNSTYLNDLKPGVTPEWRDVWTAEDNYYYIFFTPIYSGIPIIEEEHGNWEIGTAVSGSKIEICYSKRGLEYLSTDFLYNTSEKENKPLIDIDTLLAAVKEKYSNVILTDDVEFHLITNCYVPITVDDKENPYRLVPAWHLKGVQKNVGDTEGPRFDLPLDVYINAITGKEII